MAETRRRRRKVQRGVIDTLDSGAVRVRVDAGIDPVTKKRHRLTKIIPADTPDKGAAAEQARVRMLNEVHERRNPKTRATVDQLLDRYLREFDGAWSTRHNYQNLRSNHVSPLIGKVKVGDIDADILDSLYAELRRCRDHCTGLFVQHRTSSEHECDQRCGRHRCSPLGVSGIRQIHWLLSGAFRCAVRWKWVQRNPVTEAAPPAPTPPTPKPPSMSEAASILNEAASRDVAWATLVWLAMTTGARRHELCALRWSDVVSDDEYTTLSVSRGISKDRHGRWAELDTKTHQRRRVALDTGTATVLREHGDRCSSQVAALGLELAPDAFLFSPAPDFSRFLRPDSVTQRYDRMVDKLGITTTIHKLRHYSATELIKAGADINTVAGRLGHGGGGTMTLKVYTAFVSEVDQRAARQLGARMPERRWEELDPAERAKTAPQVPFERVAAAVRQQILDGDLEGGAPVPTVKELTVYYNVAAGTVQRALELLSTWGLITQSGRGRRATVIRPDEGSRAVTVESTHVEVDSAATVLDLRLLFLGEELHRFTAEADPNDPGQLRRLLTSAIRRHGSKDATSENFELEVRHSDSLEIIRSFVAL